MPAEGKVSLAWQIIMVLLIPIAGIWAFYRIKRLQKAFLYIMLPQIIMVVVVIVCFDLANEQMLMTLLDLH